MATESGHHFDDSEFLPYERCPDISGEQKFDEYFLIKLLTSLDARQQLPRQRCRLGDCRDDPRSGSDSSAKETPECETELINPLHESLSGLLREIQSMKTLLLGQLVGDMPAKSDSLGGSIGASQVCRICRLHTGSTRQVQLEGDN